MKYWKYVEAVDGALELLARLSKESKIYIATGAEDSNEKDIESAFTRVGLSKYISGYYCFGNVGHKKGTDNYLETIIVKLGVSPDEITAVGDNYEKDIVPALEAGLNTIWYNQNATDERYSESKAVSSLRQI